MTRERSVDRRPGERDALAEQLDELKLVKGIQTLKIDQMFGHRPAVLQAIRDARARGLGPESIAKALSREGQPVTQAAVRTWLQRQGIK